MKLWRLVFQSIINRFDLTADKADENAAIESIRAGVQFKGTNLWVLIFAIFIASIGLNVNSAAVIIGAMLISPLMGPIMGIGLGIGINDFELIRKAAYNLLVAVAFSVLTSTLYFLVSPLSDAQSELLARTQPTIWDVLIALFGGLSGIIANTRKEKSNVIPGVAIATALMPPLCTAGYGLANGNLAYFIGAFYLFFINSVFISLSTFLIVRLLKYPMASFVDVKTETRVKRSVWTVVILTIIPSVYLAYKIVHKTFEERNIDNFVKTEFNYENTRVVTKEITHFGDSIQIKLFFVGDELSKEQIQIAKNKLGYYGLDAAKLQVNQASKKSEVNLTELKQDFLREYLSIKEEEIKNKDKEIETLKNNLANFSKIDELSPEIKEELKVLYPDITDCIFAKTQYKGKTLLLAYIDAKSTKKIDKKKLKAFLTKRMDEDNLKLIFE